MADAVQEFIFLQITFPTSHSSLNPARRKHALTAALKCCRFIAVSQPASSAA